jgi:hypothetical protein
MHLHRNGHETLLNVAKKCNVEDPFSGTTVSLVAAGLPDDV